MKFEKLNENKIRITLSNQDLIEKHIDFNSFMSNSIETQDLFLDVLEEAEQKVGFVTKDHKIKIEALAMADGDFVLTITRFGKREEKEIQSTNKSKKIKAKRKSTTLNSENLVYSFNTFDDFCLFSSFVGKIKNFSTIAKSTLLYTYNDKYYLVFSKLNLNHPYIKKFYTLITEFGTYINNSDLFSYKLYERGKLVFKNNAIKLCLKYFK
ncbi:MAG: adaptor protein MecA [Clostridia bacterium]|nr:adaptor protein MecA [Clostridia bacterium]